jgi:diketogulonate reductase-like aldo/keto reductase
MKRSKVKPLYGFGTHRLKGDACYKSALFALRKGYNLIDTAEKYNNSVEIGKAIKKSRKKRTSFKIVHKLTDVLEFTRTSKETNLKVQKYMYDLQVDYIDILLMHGPSPRYHETPEIFKEGNIRVWEEMFRLRQKGYLKAIGVSNFNKEQIMYLIEATGIIPEYLEIEYNVLNWHEAIMLREWSDRMGIKVISYSPLLAGKLAKVTIDPDYLKYSKTKVEVITEAEYCLRFCLTHGVIPLPRSSNKNRIKENLKSLKKGKL